MPQFLCCFVKCFYFVWSKSIRACQKSVGGAASIAVPTWWAVSLTKGGIGISIGWRVVGNMKIMASSESRSIRRAVAYGITVIAIHRKFHRCQSWLVNQREKECLGIISILAAGTCWENNKWKGLAIQRLRSSRNSLTPLAKIWNSENCVFNTKNKLILTFKYLKVFTFGRKKLVLILKAKRKKRLNRAINYIPI